MRRVRLYVDLDDVLCETARAFLRVLERRHGRRLELEDLTEFDLGRTLGLETGELDRFLAEVHRPEVMGELEPVSGALETLRSWRRHGWEIVVVTGRPPSARPVSERWLVRHAVPHDGLLFVDKYGHSSAWAGDGDAVAPAALAAEGFALAVEDAPKMALFLATELDTRVLLLDRPWNRSGDLEAATAGRLERCIGWSEVALRVGGMLATSPAAPARRAVGRLVGLAVRPAPGVPMTTRGEAAVDERLGLEGDHRSRPGRRQLTVLTREGWDAACAELGRELPWTVRRANLLVEGLDLEGATGCRLRAGSALLEVTGETRPCRHIEVHAGLREALEPEWRGGVTCRVLVGGRVALGTEVELLPATQCGVAE